MTSYWKARVGLTDDNGKETSIAVQIGEITGVDFAAEAADAQTRLSDYVTDLKAISLANVTSITLTCVDPSAQQDTGKSSTGADVSEELVLIVYTDDPDQVGEVDRLRVPAPEATVWINDSYEEGFDLNDALASALVANYASSLEFSDSEHVDTALGTDGIKAGFWRSRKMQVRS